MRVIQTDLANLRQSGILMTALCFPGLSSLCLSSPETATDGLRWVAILFAILDPGMGECDQLDWESCVCLLICLRVPLLK